MHRFLPYGLQEIDKGDIDEVTSVLRSDWITAGPKIKEFEDKLCAYVGSKHAVAVCNGTAALDIAVQSLNLPTGSEIITSPFTFVATSNAILYNKCRPVFVDIKRDTRNINPEKIREKITDKTKAIIYVDYAGQPCDIKGIKEIAEESDLYLIEDACHAIGAEYHGKKIGSFADMTVFSFHPVKHITTGEGGAVVTNKSEFYQRLRMLRNHGIDKDASERFGRAKGYIYDMKMLGRNYRITDFQCALGISQLEKLDAFISRRQEIVGKYSEAFNGITEIETPFVKGDIRHAWHIYTVLLSKADRDNFYKKMRERNIGVNVHYIPVYHLSYYQKNFGFNPRDFPVTECVFDNIITLPLFPKMRDEDVVYVIQNTIDILQNQ
jgi:UDP-4-amino-4,6-dideoxy-N-acetyl-beta-L-altrosamine transaminase